MAAGPDRTLTQGVRSSAGPPRGLRRTVTQGPPLAVGIETNSPQSTARRKTLRGSSLPSARKEEEPMSPTKNRRARDAVRRPKPACSGPKGQGKRVPCARRLAASRAAPRLPRGTRNPPGRQAAELLACARALPLIDRHVIARFRAGIDLARTADLLVRILQHLLPLRDPADGARQREQRGEHAGRESPAPSA